MKTIKYIVFVLIFFVSSCTLMRDYDFDTTPNSLGKMRMVDYLTTNRDTSLTIYTQAMEYAGLGELLTNNDLYTLIIPTNDAFRQLFKEAGVKNINQINKGVVRSIMQYTVLPGRYVSYEIDANVSSKVTTLSGERFYLARIPTTKDQYPLYINAIQTTDPLADPTFASIKSVVSQQDMVFKDKVAQVVGIVPLFQISVASPDIAPSDGREVARLSTSGDTHIYNGSATAVYWDKAVAGNYQISKAQWRYPVIRFEKKDIPFKDKIASAKLNIYVRANNTSTPYVSDFYIFDISAKANNFTDMKQIKKGSLPWEWSTQIGAAYSAAPTSWNQADLTTFFKEYYQRPEEQQLPLTITLRASVAHQGGGYEFGYLHEDTPDPVNSRPAYIDIYGIIVSELSVASNNPLDCPKEGMAILTKDAISMKGESQKGLNYTDNNIFFLLEDIPADGVVTKNGLPIGKGKRITQQEIAAGIIKYYNNGASGTDQFTFSVSDYSGGNYHENVTVNVTIR